MLGGWPGPARLGSSTRSSPHLGSRAHYVLGAPRVVWASLRGRGSPYCPYRPKHRGEVPGQVPPEGLDSTLPVPLPHGLTMAALPSNCGSVYSPGNGVERLRSAAHGQGWGLEARPAQVYTGDPRRVALQEVTAWEPPNHVPGSGSCCHEMSLQAEEAEERGGEAQAF